MMENRQQKPKTAAVTVRRKRHRKTTSQLNLREENLHGNFNEGITTSRNIYTYESNRRNEFDSSKLINFDIFNINGVLGNKAIMATTSPSLLLNHRPKSRIKTIAKTTRRRKIEIDSELATNNLDLIEENHPLHYRPITQSGIKTERQVKLSLSDPNTIDFQAIIRDKDSQILHLKNKLV